MKAWNPGVLKLYSHYIDKVNPYQINEVQRCLSMYFRWIRRSNNNWFTLHSAI